MATPPPWNTALVTGASAGLGRGLALWLARRGVRVWAAARRTGALDALRAEAGEAITPVAMDVSDAEATFALVRALDGQCGGFDLVVANAGVGEKEKVERLDFASVNRMNQVNVAGAAATLYGAIPGMVERNRGHLAGIASLAGLVAFPESATYGATKAYLRILLDGLRLDLARYGISVTSIHPGFVKSEMTARNDPRQMPFLLETDDAVERMGQALLRRDRQFFFPWQTAAAVRAVHALPSGLWQAMAGRKGRSKRRTGP